ncbi:MAG: AMP-binding enzyme [Acidimicrobiales bacterium]
MHEVAVVGVVDEEWGEVVSAIVVRNGECSAEELIEFCARAPVWALKLQSLLFSSMSFRKTGSGKVLKRELRDRVDLPYSIGGLTTPLPQAYVAFF